MADDVSIWQALRKSLTKPQFVERHPFPFLLRRRLARTVAVPADTGAEDDAWMDRVAFDTNVVDASELVAAPSAGRLRGARVARLVKAPGNPFPDRISLGRAQNCDIVVRDPSVSKLHAQFRVLDTAHAELVDVKSANGTRLNGRVLVPMQATSVSPGDTLIFGGVAVQFVDALRLYDLLS